MASQALTTDELQAIRDGHAAGLSLSAIALELGRGKTSISKHAKRMGLDWSEKRTAAATEAAVSGNRAKRAALETRLLDEASLLLDQLHQPHIAYNFGGKDNTYAEHKQAEPDITGKRALVQSASTAITHALKLADADKATTGAAAGASMVGSLFTSLALAWAPDTEEPPTETEGAPS